MAPVQRSLVSDVPGSLYKHAAGWERLISRRPIDPPLFIDYARGQAYHTDKTARVARFQRATNRSGMSLPTSALMSSEKPSTLANGTPDEVDRSATIERPVSRSATAVSTPPSVPAFKAPAHVHDPTPAVETDPPKSNASVQLSAVALASPMAAPRPPSAFGRPPSVFGHLPPAQTGPSAIRPSAGAAEEDDPLARQLAELRRDPPPAGSIRRGNSVRRPGSVTGSVNSSSQYRSKSPGPVHPQNQSQPQEAHSMTERQRMPPQQASQHRQSYQNHAPGRPSMDTSLVPPTPGHTAADLARSKAEHERRNSRHFPSAQEQGYDNAAEDVVGNHPTSRPPSVSGLAPRAPTPVFMQPPIMPAAPVADQVLDQYHQALPGERSRSRAGTANSRPGSRMGGSFSADTEPATQTTDRPPRPSSVREGFVGIGAGGRSPSPQPGAYQSLTSPPVEQVRSTTPGGSWNATHRYSQSQVQGSSQPGTLQRPQSQSTRYSIHGNPPQYDQRQSMYGANPSVAQQHQHGSISGQSFHGSATSNSRYGSVTSPVNLANQHGSVGSLAGHPSQAPYPGQQATSPSPYGQPVSQTGAYGQGPVMQSSTGFPVPAQPSYQRPPSAQPGYPTPVTANAAPSPYPQQHGQYRPASTAPIPAPLNIPTQYQSSVSPAPGAIQSPHQQQPNQYYAAPQPQPTYAQPGQYAASGYGAPAGQPVRTAQDPPAGIARSTSPQPPPVPAETPPTGQYSTTGQPVLFCKPFDFRGRHRVKKLTCSCSLFRWYVEHSPVTVRGLKREANLCATSSHSVKALYDYQAQSGTRVTSDVR